MSQQNVEIVRRVHEAFNARDVKAVLELVRPDVEWRPALFGAESWKGPSIAAMRASPTS
jgi:ketosteroid isomerase-like protein